MVLDLYLVAEEPSVIAAASCVQELASADMNQACWFESRSSLSMNLDAGTAMKYI